MKISDFEPEKSTVNSDAMAVRCATRYYESCEMIIGYVKEHFNRELSSDLYVKVLRMHVELNDEFASLPADRLNELISLGLTDQDADKGVRDGHYWALNGPSGPVKMRPVPGYCQSFDGMGALIDDLLPDYEVVMMGKIDCWQPGQTDVTKRFFVANVFAAEALAETMPQAVAIAAAIAMSVNVDMQPGQKEGFRN